ncbi:MAG TPA: cysteine synthase family protein [Pseudonocardiaceae bacterium]|nr:cysteine synthase family protein [Pseudonocardiaceae bacterium]
MNIHCGTSSLIGGTPLVRLLRMFPVCGPQVYLKMEQFNPGGSVKDRTALGMLSYEEHRGRLRPGMTIVESSSGNTAIALAVLGKEKGYRVVAVCDRHLPSAKRARLRTVGASIVFLPETPVGMDTVQLRIAVANRISEEVESAITLGQYSHPGNPDIHYRTTGPEIWTDLGNDVAAVVVAVGTCGTIAGVGRWAKERDPRTMVVGVEPEGSVIFGGVPGRCLIQGGGLDFVPPIYDPAVVDVGLKISDSEAFGAVQEVGVTEGWMIGGTGGLVVSGIRRILSHFGPADAVVGIIPDGGDRYVDTLFNAAWLRASGMGRPLPDDPPDGDTAAAAAALGCSVNRIPATPGTSLDAMRRRLELVPRP